jgi:hypothetical protein
MDQNEDVERLFSWLKAPMVHYREFAPQRELAEAVSTWPVAHRAAVQAGVATEGEPAPQGDTAAKERIARDRRTLPSMPPPVQYVPPAEPAPYQLPPEATAGMTPGRLQDRPASTSGEPVPVARDEPAAPVAAATVPAPQTLPDHTVEPTLSGFEPPPQPSAAVREQPYGGNRGEPARHYPAGERDALFGGEYRGSERETRPGSRAADRQDRSLDAVFLRISGRGDRLPDPRARARTNPGLGPVFRRLR